MRDELQELVDEVSRVLGAPATLEDAGFTLLAFCAHDDSGADPMDTVRTRSILTRSSTPETRRWFEDFGIAAATRPMRTPADPAAGVLTRLVLPVRHEDRTHGYLWLLDDGRTDPDDDADPALRRALDLAADAGRALAGRPADDLGQVLADALIGRPAARAQAALRLRDRLPADGAQVLVALRPTDGPPAPARPLPAAGAVATVVDDGIAVLVPLPAPADLRPAGALAAASLATLPAGSTAGVSSARRGTDDLAGQWGEARAAARVAAAVDRFFPVARWGELGGWRAATALPGPDPVLAPLLADPVLTTTAETFLDCAGSAARTAAALHVHRQTLYYRLGRIAALTGLDLADGDARLLLHAGLRAARLSGGSGCHRP
ncbi:PucR family transcriptional regulator [Blastococcus sp. MG754426]|uniref:PucR family transcriptional regulator n=1 Tax=unclassified Blastococcus TaxID=2619396 RepID=UPI001EF0E175|nr:MULTISPECIES: helix-turn-helix domain-containing protein [unclassified Blastococcus]MCF6506893.1 PucR family transcriptional regulator [Blastococcus sp. MG754426]MCF6511861.1 PucR family transcriptional regulator [Blastococcus sp. MG754427]